MTEQEWLACTDPDRKLRALPARQEERKLGLFACACARRAWRLVTNEKDSQALPQLDDETEEWRRGRRSNISTLVAVGMALARTMHAGARAVGYNTSPTFLTGVADVVVSARVARAAAVASRGRPVKLCRSKERRAQRELLRDIFGNPFRRVICQRAWKTTTVETLARAAYDERRLPGGELERVRLAILADALEEAGCTDAEMLNHCREPGVHVRGCWVVDALLAKD